MKTELFQSCGHCWVFQICWHVQCSTFTASSFRIWNSSTGIPSPPLALFVVMLSLMSFKLEQFPRLFLVMCDMTFHCLVWCWWWACHIRPLLCWSCSFYTQFVQCFYPEMTYFVKYFFCIYWNDHMIFIFSFLMWYITFIDLNMLNHPCLSRIVLTWSWYILLFMYCWVCPAILLRILVTSVTLVYSFLTVSFSDLGIQ